MATLVVFLFALPLWKSVEMAGLTAGGFEFYGLGMGCVIIVGGPRENGGVFLAGLCIILSQNCISVAGGNAQLCYQAVVNQLKQSLQGDFVSLFRSAV